MSIEFLLEGVLPARVRAIQTNRYPVGDTLTKSLSPYDSFNLGAHVQDSFEQVQQNRQTLLQAMPGCEQLHWLEQTHSIQAHTISQVSGDLAIFADASITCLPHQACVVMTADCLPLLLWANDGSEVAAVHAGWRGLLEGVIEATIANMTTPTENISVWLGPCIGPTTFEVGDEIYQAFIAKESAAAQGFALGTSKGKWLANLHLLARQRLGKLGILHIYADARCTYTEANTFYSYRREGVTGRMASAIWIDSLS